MAHMVAHMSDEVTEKEVGSGSHARKLLHDAVEATELVAACTHLRDEEGFDFLADIAATSETITPPPAPGWRDTDRTPRG